MPERLLSCSCHDLYKNNNAIYKNSEAVVNNERLSGGTQEPQKRIPTLPFRYSSCPSLKFTVVQLEKSGDEAYENEESHQKVKREGESSLNIIKLPASTLDETSHESAIGNVNAAPRHDRSQSTSENTQGTSAQSAGVVSKKMPTKDEFLKSLPCPNLLQNTQPPAKTYSLERKLERNISILKLIIRLGQRLESIGYKVGIVAIVTGITGFILASAGLIIGIVSGSMVAIVGGAVLLLAVILSSIIRAKSPPGKRVWLTDVIAISGDAGLCVGAIMTGGMVGLIGGIILIVANVVSQIGRLAIRISMACAQLSPRL